MIAWVRFEDRRDAEASRFAHLLNGVGELRHFVRRHLRTEERVASIPGRVRHGVAENEASHLLLKEQLACQERDLPACVGVQLVNHQHPGLLVQRHLRKQIGDAGLNRLSPVFVGVDIAVFVEVSERNSVVVENFNGSRLNLRPMPVIV